MRAKYNSDIAKREKYIVNAIAVSVNKQLATTKKTFEIPRFAAVPIICIILKQMHLYQIQYLHGT